MRIEIDNKYLLTSDSMCVTVYEKSLNKKGKPSLVRLGYHTSVPSALMSVLKHRTLKSTATDLKTLISEHRVFHDIVQKAFDETITKNGSTSDLAKK